MKIIGLAAKAGGGKDTAGDLIRSSLEERGYSTTQISFANPLKDICTMLFGWDRKRLQTDAKFKESSLLDDGSPDPACEMLGMSRREVMQLLGTEAMRRGLHTDIWIIAMKLAIQRGDYNQYDYGLLTDCRFINELQFVRDLDGTLIRIDRAGEQSTLTEHTEHASELEWQEWTDWDAIVINEGIVPDSPLTFSLRLFSARLERALGFSKLDGIDNYVTLVREGREIRANIAKQFSETT